MIPWPLWLSVLATTPNTPSVAVFYGDKLPIAELALYDWVVVEPRHLLDPKPLLARDTVAFAYVSIGEAHPSREWFSALDSLWVRGDNTTWGSKVMDLAQPGWRDFLLNTVMAPLWQQGYRAFFLDTLDSFHLSAKDPADFAKQKAGLAAIIKAIKARFDGVRILTNRGFDVMEDVGGLIDGVAAESLFGRWDNQQRRYVDVPAADRAWLLAKLEDVRTRYKIPVISIDYAPAEHRSYQRQLAEQIAALDIVPWVADGDLQTMGVGLIETIPRRMLMIYDDTHVDMAHSSAHLHGAMPLEYLGFAVDYRSVKAPFKKEQLRNVYRGVLVWVEGGLGERNRELGQWLEDRLNEAVPVLLLGSVGYLEDPQLLRRLGLVRPNEPKGALRLTHVDAMLNFEAKPRVRRFGLEPLQNRDAAMASLQMLDASNERFEPIAITEWGGYATYPYFMELFQQKSRWVVDPFLLFRRALKLEAAPRFDLTTENGRRLLLSHIDGDGAVSRAEMPGTPYASEVILKKILERYPLPHTVSVVEGEVGAQGLYPRASAEVSNIMRRIFAMPSVEIASHGYSHPFAWEEFEKGLTGPEYHLPIPNFQPSVRREIAGSVAYINRELAPPGKSCDVFLWTGDALPGEKSMAITGEHGLLNVNGGGTTINSIDNSVSYVSPAARPIGPFLQVYAPVMNENVYTNLWTGPFYGFQRVRETFALTESPRRLKPINIYYHFYSGSKPAAVRALERVYDWAMARPSHPQWIGQYSRLVHDFYREGLARTLDGAWLLPVTESMRTVRLDRELGYPDLARSTGVAGYVEGPDGLYVHLAPVHRARLYTHNTAATVPYLRSSNAKLKTWQREGSTLHMRFEGHMPVEIELGAAQSCQWVDANSSAGKLSQDDKGVVTIKFSEQKVADIHLSCPH